MPKALPQHSPYNLIQYFTSISVFLKKSFFQKHIKNIYILPQFKSSKGLFTFVFVKNYILNTLQKKVSLQF